MKVTAVAIKKLKSEFRKIKCLTTKIHEKENTNLSNSKSNRNKVNIEVLYNLHI